MAETYYDEDLAYIHDQGFLRYARGAALYVLELLARRGINTGQVVDLGCGSGFWAAQLAAAGYDPVGVDISPAMIALCRQRVPQGTFHVGSFLRTPIPHCRAVTALGEVVNYLFDRRNSLDALRRVCTKAYKALSSPGLLVFDFAEPGRNRGLKQRFFEGDDWTCLVEYQHDDARQQLNRRIITFRKLGNSYRRHEETHRQQLYTAAAVAPLLRKIGFRVRLVRHWGEFALPPGLVGCVARKD